MECLFPELVTCEKQSFHYPTVWYNSGVYSVFYGREVFVYDRGTLSTAMLSCHPSASNPTQGACSLYFLLINTSGPAHLVIAPFN